MNRKLASIAIVIFSVSTLFGCASAPGYASDSGETREQYNTSNRAIEITKTLEDGREITCLVINGAYDYSLSCDWESK